MHFEANTSSIIFEKQKSEILVSVVHIFLTVCIYSENQYRAEVSDSQAILETVKKWLLSLLCCFTSTVNI